MILVLVLVLLVGVCYIKYMGNKELIKNNCKTEVDKDNAKNARKVYSSTKTSKALLILSFVSLIIVFLLKFTDIDYIIRDFVSTELIERRSISYLAFLIPFYILVSRQIIIEVNLGDFLYKFFNVEEPQLEEGAIKSLLFKKSTAKEKATFEEMLKQKEAEMQSMPEILDPNPEAPKIITDEKKEEQKPVEKEEVATEQPLAREEEKKEEIELPEIKKENQ